MRLPGELGVESHTSSLSQDDITNIGLIKELMADDNIFNLPLVQDAIASNGVKNILANEYFKKFIISLINKYKELNKIVDDALATATTNIDDYVKRNINNIDIMNLSADQKVRDFSEEEYIQAVKIGCHAQKNYQQQVLKLMQDLNEDLNNKAGRKLIKDLLQDSLLRGLFEDGVVKEVKIVKLIKTLILQMGKEAKKSTKLSSIGDLNTKKPKQQIFSVIAAPDNGRFSQVKSEKNQEMSHIAQSEPEKNNNLFGYCV